MPIYKYVELAFYISINGIMSARGCSQNANVADMRLGRLSCTFLLAALYYSAWTSKDGNPCNLFP